jgi:hypothetical protein
MHENQRPEDVFHALSNLEYRQFMRFRDDIVPSKDRNNVMKIL